MSWSRQDFQSVFRAMQQINGDLSDVAQYDHFWKEFPYHELSHGELDELLDVTLVELDKSRFYAMPRFYSLYQHIATEAMRIMEWDTPKAGAGEITNHMRVFASHRLLPPKKLLDGIKDRIIELQVIKKPFNLAHIARTFATLSEHPGQEIVELLSKSLIDVRDKLKPKDIAMLAWSFSIFQIQFPNETNLPIISLLHQDAQQVVSDFSNANSTQFFDASLHNGLPLLHTRDVQEEQASRTELRVQQILRSSLAYRIPDAERIPGLNHDIDLAIEWKGQRFYIEVDGPFHFVMGLDGVPLRLDGNTLLQSALLKKCMPTARIVRMREADIETICQSSYSVNRFLSMSICLPAGVYITQDRGSGGEVALNSILPSRTPHLVEHFSFDNLKVA